jgi:hypothetical protein
MIQKLAHRWMTGYDWHVRGEPERPAAVHLTQIRRMIGAAVCDRLDVVDVRSCALRRLHLAKGDR